jgi:ABC-type multidrug transport system fused ATPase/permease subunit
MFLPRALSAAADASNALHRLSELLEADLRSEEERVDTDLDVAIRAQNATFEWLSVAAENESAKKGQKVSKKDKQTETSGASTPKQAEPFKIVDLHLAIPRGQLVGIVGAVGSGKSSILAGLVGEMKQASGTVKFGGRIAYCAQHAFIQNATLRDNVLFGQPWDEERYWQVIEEACLVPDCLQLPDGDLTGIQRPLPQYSRNQLTLRKSQKLERGVSISRAARSSESMSLEHSTLVPISYCSTIPSVLSTLTSAKPYSKYYPANSSSRGKPLFL